MALVFLLVLVAVCMGACSGCPISVSHTSGSDTPVCGASTSPCQTIDHALSRIPTGVTSCSISLLNTDNYPCNNVMIDKPGVALSIMGNPSGSGDERVVFDCKGSNRAFQVLSSQVAFENIEVRRGYSNSTGGAISVTCGSACVHSFKNCWLQNNHADVSGGGIYISYLQEAFDPCDQPLSSTVPNVQLTITDSTFDRNTAFSGGGMLVEIMHPLQNIDIVVSSANFTSNFANGIATSAGLLIMSHNMTRNHHSSVIGSTFLHNKSPNASYGALTSMSRGEVCNGQHVLSKNFFEKNDRYGAHMMFSRESTDTFISIEECNFIENGPINENQNRDSSVSGGGLSIFHFGTVEHNTIIINGGLFQGNFGGKLLETTDISLSVGSQLFGGGAEIAAFSFSRFCNFTARNVVFQDNLSVGGSAIFVHHRRFSNSTVVTFDSCKFVNNNAAQYGGGAIHIVRSGRSHGDVDTITNCEFTNNYAMSDWGGALNVLFAEEVLDSIVIIEDSVFQGNQAKAAAGVALFASSDASFSGFQFTVQRTQFLKNVAQQSAGGMAFYTADDVARQAYQGSVFTLNDLLFHGNEAGGSGGGLQLSPAAVNGGLSVYLLNSQFSNNTAGASGGAAIIENCNYTSMNNIHMEYGEKEGSKVALDSGNVFFFDGGHIEIGDSEILQPIGGNQGAFFTFFQNAALDFQNFNVSSDSGGALIGTMSVDLQSGDNSSMFLCPLGSTQSKDPTPIVFYRTTVKLKDREPQGTVSTAYTRLYGEYSCVVCRAGTYYLDKGSNHVGGSCKPCPEHAKCPGGNKVVATKGKWAANPLCMVEPTEVNLYSCPEGFCDDNGKCSSGRKAASENILCGACDSKYVHVHRDCRACTDREGVRNVFIVLIASLLYLIFLIFFCSAYLAGKKKVFMYWAQTLKLVLGPISKWAPFLSFFSFNMAKFLCLGQVSTEGILVYDLVYPLIYGILMALLYACWVYYDKRRKRLLEERDKIELGNGNSLRDPLMSQQQEDTYELLDYNDNGGTKPDNEDQEGYEYDRQQGYIDIEGVDVSQLSRMVIPPTPKPPLDASYLRPFMRTASMLVVFTYSHLTASCLHLLSCEQVGSCHQVLSEYPDFSCASPSYRHFRNYGIVMVTFYVIPFPALLILYLWRLGEEKRNTKECLGSLGVFYEMYKPHVWWWQAQELYRRLLMVFLYVHYFNRPWERALCMAILSWIYLAIHMYVWPYKGNLENRLEFWSMLALGSIATIEQAQAANGQDSGLGVVASVIAGVGFVYIAGVIGFFLIRKYWARLSSRMDVLAIKAVETKLQKPPLPHQPRKHVQQSL